MSDSDSSVSTYILANTVYCQRPQLIANCYRYNYTKEADTIATKQGHIYT